MKRKHQYIRYLLLMTVSFLLTGCWSSKEIEDLGIIVGTSLDLETGDVSSEEQQDARYANRDLLTITNQFITSETTVSGTKEGTLPEKAYKNVTETGDAVLPTLRNMLLKVDKRSFAEHSKVIIIGEDLASTVNLQQTLDFFLRELEIRPSGLLLIAQNRASQALETNEPTKIPAFQLVEMMEGHERTTKILPPMTVAKLEGKLYSDSSFLLQNVLAEDGEVRFAGAAVIEGKTKKLRGFLNESDLEGIAWITGEGKGGLVKGFDEESGAPIIYEIISAKSKIIPLIKDDQISFTIKIQTEGRISEHWVLSDKAFDNRFLKKAEKVFEKEIERLVKKVLEKTQHEFQTDVAGFGNKIRIDYPKVWQKIKKDWDQTFSEVPITCEVNVTIKDYGTSGD
ncbi:MAG TPA: Ger(x)C family spore germination protein [Lysinibacillus sp.]|uniref:Ger(x)C family spore germination protein n=1 Tax=Lysinibacillus TaxID=400634 RepID=UPI00055D1465|nr:MULTISPECIES: Ger(x)C family spore germination protein [Lysinibacillus]KUF32758.1 spore gernimation protein GerC [Lysinibacillus sp. F5]MEE3805642.1 Ger(x)C family spore germination protein [Lysinibacillus fusiformis]WCH46651.1 Ger(x)C family spore germination protein [Lysinibacillus sp. OF-1]HBT73326.1 Ger(x)C family spore germination protein [Lysinibacillus sp.]